MIRETDVLVRTSILVFATLLIFSILAPLGYGLILFIRVDVIKSASAG